MARVLVRKDTSHDRQGNARLVKARFVVQEITHFFEGNRVRTSSGDVWRVVPHGERGVEWKAVA